MTKLILEIPQKSALDALLPLLKVLGIKVTQVEIPDSQKTDLEEAIKVVRRGCDMSDYGDALTYQRDVREDRTLPFSD